MPHTVIYLPFFNGLSRIITYPPSRLIYTLYVLLSSRPPVTNKGSRSTNTERIPSAEGYPVLGFEKINGLFISIYLLPPIPFQKFM